ncbi:hypothetical protein [Clostridium akagii]|uniref:hypothetical protein n=1 Tax=Clostridium akagii TaxID=91623 RepID=UPI00047E7CF4|nr:hypothetical protein [Clostridium akagii]
MASNKKTIIYCVLILIISLIFIAGYVAKHSKENDSSKSVQQVTDNARVISTMELKSIARGGVVSLVDDSPAAFSWAPRNQKITLSEITYWLHGATIYRGKIPKSQNVALFKANVGPSILNISYSNKVNITIQPAFYLGSKNALNIQYIRDVLQLNNDGKKSYIQSKQLFNWLKNDKWKTEFEMKH